MKQCPTKVLIENVRAIPKYCAVEDIPNLRNIKESLREFEPNLYDRIVGKGDEWLQNFYRFNFLPYKKYQNILDVQRTQNISAIVFKTIWVKGCLLRYPDLAEELEPRPQDFLIMQRFHKKNVQKFAKLCTRLNLTCSDGAHDRDVEQLEATANSFDRSTFSQRHETSGKTKQIYYVLECTNVNESEMFYWLAR